MVGASSSIVWTFANASDTSHLTVTYGDGDKTYSGIKTRYVNIIINYISYVTCMGDYFLKALKIIYASKISHEQLIIDEFCACLIVHPLT